MQPHYHYRKEPIKLMYDKEYCENRDKFLYKLFYIAVVFILLVFIMAFLNN